ncbi:translation initiation inhibitor [Virgibacillus sp. NKC19-16]|uniref:RidA family protein n=1 Tax=Virgibacillus salidurans TaxID=2831673 RepID=UPI001EECAE19|nr:Rid family hydrolase [Virgibacillus sp. NKC19-16]UJL47474.1 translation initiation inhibitor [Virgibacillus sp. NKC19-16]
MKQIIQTKNAPQPSGPYSQGVNVENFIFVSGMDGVHPNGDLAGDTISEQTTASLENIKHVLAEANGTINDIVYVTCHLADLNQDTVAEFNQAYEAFFKDVANKPARITVGSQLLEVNVEISAIAYRE